MVGWHHQLEGHEFEQTLGVATDREAWHAAVHGVTKSQTQLKRLSKETATTLGRKVMTNLDSILKSRDITLPTKVCLVKAMVFPVVMYGWESWTVKKAEHRRIDAFELWCWRRLESPLDCKEIQPVHSKGDPSWVFFGRNDAEAETPVLWPPHVKS